MRFGTVLVLASAMVVLSSCATRSERSELSIEEVAILEARERQNAALAARDHVNAARWWQEDVLVTAGLGARLVGRTSYQRAFEVDHTILYRRDPTEVVVNPDQPIAFESGTWVGRDRATNTVRLKGRYSAQWVKQGEEWRIRSELFVATSCSDVACSWEVEAGSAR